MVRKGDQIFNNQLHLSVILMLLYWLLLLMLLLLLLLAWSETEMVGAIWPE